MKFGIAARLSWVLALVSGLIAGLTGLYAYRASHALLVQSAKNELQASTRVLSNRIVIQRQSISRDLQVLARHPASVAVLQNGPSTAADQLTTLFELFMRTNPGYFQLRLISASEHGLERVRVDRDGSQLVRVRGDDLQEKSHYPYVSDTLKLPAGSTYLSRIVINHERGAHNGLNQPTAQLASPVTDASGQALGVIVINLDLNGVFSLLLADLPSEFQVFLTNQNGDFLIHPDPAQTFGFDRGRRVLLQDEFAATQALVSGEVSQILLEATTGRHAKEPVVAAFISTRVKVSSDENQLILGVAQPLRRVLERADQLGATILQIVAGFGLVGVLLAVLLARWITRPLNAMSAAVQGFSTDKAITTLPVGRDDELGQLARSFDHMQNQIRQQFAELQSNRLELEHLARHDVLTGLPNRRLFMERLHSAIELAKRHNRQLALLFIDLDDFKGINDSLGHDAGDTALQAVAQRLLSNTRKVDTVARLGGDEFVLLLDNPQHRDQVAAIAQKLQVSTTQPVKFGAHTFNVGLSIGISLYPHDGISADQLITAADRAMYQVKSGSANSYCFAEESERPA